MVCSDGMRNNKVMMPVCVCVCVESVCIHATTEGIASVVGPLRFISRSPRKRPTHSPNHPPPNLINPRSLYLSASEVFICSIISQMSVFVNFLDCSAGRRSRCYRTDMRSFLNGNIRSGVKTRRGGGGRLKAGGGTKIDEWPLP